MKIQQTASMVVTNKPCVKQYNKNFKIKNLITRKTFYNLFTKSNKEMGRNISKTNSTSVQSRNYGYKEVELELQIFGI